MLVVHHSCKQKSYYLNWLLGIRLQCQELTKPMLPFVGDALYDEMESSTLDMPDKKKYKRPPSGVRQTRRSASAEMIDRDEDEVMADNENMSPARRRPRRKRNQG